MINKFRGRQNSNLRPPGCPERMLDEKQKCCFLVFTVLHYLYQYKISENYEAVEGPNLKNPQHESQ